MEQKSLARWLKIILVGVALCALAVYGVVLPSLGLSIAGANPEYAFCFWPWLIFLWGTALPCCAAFVLAWRIFTNIGQDRSFSMENARYLKGVAWLAAGDAGYFVLGNMVFLMLNMSHPGFFLLSMLVAFAGFAISVVAAALSHLVRKAAALQEQSDLTI